MQRILSRLAKACRLAEEEEVPLDYEPFPASEYIDEKGWKSQDSGGTNSDFFLSLASQK